MYRIRIYNTHITDYGVEELVQGLFIVKWVDNLLECTYRVWSSIRGLRRRTLKTEKYCTSHIRANVHELLNLN